MIKKLEMETGLGLGYGPHSRLNGNLQFAELLRSYINVDGKSVSISSDGKYIATGDGCIINCNEDKLESYDYDTYSDIDDVSISPDGKYLALVVGSEVKLFNFENGEIWSRKLETQSKSVSLSLNGDYVTVADFGSNIYLFDKKGELRWNIDGETNTNTSTANVAAISSDGSFIAVYQDSFSKIQLLDNAGKLIWDFIMNDQIKGCICISISSDGKYVIIGDRGRMGFGGIVCLFNENGEIIWTYKAEGDVHSISISSDGKYIAIGDNSIQNKDSRIYLLNNYGHTLWNCSMRREGLNFNEESVQDVSISSDGSYMIVGGTGGSSGGFSRKHSKGTIYIFKNYFN